MPTMHEPVKISDSEWEVMRVVWTKGKVDATTINELLSQSKGWKIATIKTLLGRLVKKDILHTEKTGKKFLYSAKVSEDAIVKNATANLFSHICAQKSGETIANLILEVDLTADDIAMIQGILAEKAPVQTIACNCIPGQCDCNKGGKTA